MEQKSIVQKTIDILYFLSTHPQGTKLSDIAEELGIPKTTAYDILKTLLNNDLVQYLNPHKKTYGIGTQIYVIGMTYLESSPLVRTARPYLSLLADKYQKTTFVSRRKGDRVVCIYKYTSPHAQAKTSGIGNQKLLHSTAIGKCYLAFDKTAAPLVDAIELDLFGNPVGCLTSPAKRSAFCCFQRKLFGN